MKTKLPKSFNPLTKEEKENLWAEIKESAYRLYRGTESEQPWEVANNLTNLIKLKKRYDRAMVREALAKIK